MTIENIAIDLLETVTGGLHDPPEPTAQRERPQGCAIGEPHPPSITERIGELAKRFAPWIQL